MKRNLLILGALVLTGVAAFYFLPTGGAPAGAKPLIVGFENDVPTFDPLRMGNVFALRVGSQVFEGLTRLDENNRIVGAVSDSWEHSTDLRTWTFHLREGVKFHPHPSLTEESRSLTADDVIYSFTRMLSKDAVPAGPLASVLQGAKEYQDAKSSSISAADKLDQ